MPGSLAFVLSAALLVACATVVSWRFARTPGEAFWFTTGATYLQVGGIATVLSLAHLLTGEAFLAAQLVVTLVVWGTLRRNRETASDARPPLAVSHLRAVVATPLRVGLLALILVVIAAHLVTAVRTPVHGFDDRMYRASRAAYWIQHRSLLPWDTANERQVSFAFGSELVFFWPLL